MNILLVGGAGYIGSILSRKLLTEGHRVTVLDNLLFGGESIVDLLYNKNFSFIKADIRNVKSTLPALKNVDAVINLAAIVGEHLCIANPKLARETNYKAAVNLAKLAKKLSVNRFIFISTCSNYGISDTKKLATEDSPVHPISLYAETKVAAEKFILGLGSKHFSPCVLRLGTVFGLSPRMRFDLLVSEFVREAYLRGVITVYKPQTWRPLIHIVDVADAIASVLLTKEEKISSQIFNVGYRNYQKKDIVKMIQKKIPKLKVVFSENESDKRDYKISFEKIKKTLGFVPRFSVEDGVKELFYALKSGMFPDISTNRYSNIEKIL